MSIRTMLSMFGRKPEPQRGSPETQPEDSGPEAVERFRFRVNQRLKIYLTGKSGQQGYSCLVQDVGEDLVFVSMPMEKGDYVLVHEDDEVHCILYDVSGVYHFKSKVVGRITLRVPLLCLAKPGQVQRFQQRESPRIRAYLNASYRVVTHRRLFYAPVEVEREEAYTYDISSGGVCLVSPKHLPVGLGLAMHIEVPTVTQMIRAVGEIRRVHPDPLIDRYMLGISFQDIQPQDLQCVSAYIQSGLEVGNAR